MNTSEWNYLTNRASLYLLPHGLTWAQLRYVRLIRIKIFSANQKMTHYSNFLIGWIYLLIYRIFWFEISTVPSSDKNYLEHESCTPLAKWGVPRQVFYCIFDVMYTFWEENKPNKTHLCFFNKKISRVMLICTVVYCIFPTDSCDVGQEPSPSGCANCAIGFYSGSNSVDACIQCPSGLTTIAVASTAVTDCIGKISQCKPGLSYYPCSNWCINALLLEIL